MPINLIGSGGDFTDQPVDNSAKILSKQTKITGIDEKIVTLKGRIETLSTNLENGNTIVKIKAFVGLFFARIDLHFKQKASASLSNEIKKLGGTAAHTTSASLQDAKAGAISQGSHTEVAIDKQPVPNKATIDQKLAAQSGPSLDIDMARFEGLKLPSDDGPETDSE
jgi:hypothetical protein